ncbi:LysE family translocator [Inquilinus sp. OTU3971]|uniref:LysE family translocator n=1 Tax=Inquilinus sp. OTU3971 TaxID=3043855 RepID=UPI00313CF521
MITLTALALFAVPVALAALIPGPAQTALVARVLSRDAGEALPFVLGMVAGNALWLAAAVFGLSALALAYEPVFVAVKWAGIVYLAVLAWKLWRAPAAEPDAAPRRTGGFLGGVALTLGNPKAVVFFGAVLPQVLDLAALDAAGIAAVFAVQVGIDLAVQSAYVLGAARARRFFRSPRRLRLANRSAAAMMAGSAALIASRG